MNTIRQLSQLLVRDHGDELKVLFNEIEQRHGKLSDRSLAQVIREMSARATRDKQRRGARRPNKEN